MKQWQRFLAILLCGCLTVGWMSGCASNEAPANTTTTQEDSIPMPKDTHLIRNKDGSYGGTLSEAEYGPGAPLNGRYDVEDSPYYTVNNDYYNMPSTEQRLIVPQFASYQQTMQDSSGLACLLMILNYAGQDVQEKYTELELVKQYEEVNGTKVYGNGTTPEGLVSLVENLGLGWEATNQDPNYAGEFTKETTKTFLMENLQAGKFVLVRYQSPVGFGWKVVIGYDTLGQVTNTVTKELSDQVSDDVIIFAEPFDGFDHYQDGYAIEREQDFHMWWKNMEQDGKITDPYSFVIVDTKQTIQYELQPVDDTPKQTAFEKHLPLNPNGGYGGTRSESAYGRIISGDGKWDHLNANYYKINDFYNMGSEGSRLLLKNYTVLQQTMGSSCGPCSVSGVLKYYGVEGEYFDMELILVETYEEATGKAVKGNGTNVQGLEAAAERLGFDAESSSTPNGETPPFTTYEAYMQFMRSNLEADRPVVVSHNLGSGHYLTVIGMDDMGTDYIYDDVLIIADSNDYWDGYQDGYNVYPAYKFFRQHTNGKHTLLQSHVVIYKN